MGKVGIAIALIFAIAAFSVFGSPFFAILLVAPAALLFSAYAGGAVVKATGEEGSTEESPENVGDHDQIPEGRPAGSPETRAFRRERAARSKAANPDE